MNYSWVGAVTSSGFTVSVDVTGPVNTRLAVSTSPSMSSPTYSPFTTGADGWHKLTVTGLTANTPYYWAVEEGGVLGATQGPIRTFPVAGSVASFSFGAGSCCSTGSSPATYTRIEERNPAFVLHMGDLHYLDITTNLVSVFENGYRTALGGASLQSLVNKVPISYMWDDHDYGPNNSDSTANAREAGLEAYRKVVPHYPISFTGPVNDTPLSLTFVHGRVRFVQLDVRSEAVIAGQPVGSGTLLGTTQLNWLTNIIETFTEEFLVIDVSVPWIVTGGDVTVKDDWGHAAAEREAISNAIQTYAKGKVMLIHGDSHMVAMDDGTNTNFATTPSGPGPRLCCFAPLNRSNSIKGGPYSEGTYTVSTTQYGFVEITDGGAAGVSVKATGYTGSDTQLVSMEFVVGDVVPAPFGDTEKPQKAQWFYAGSWWAIGKSGTDWRVYRWAGLDSWAIASPVISSVATTMDAHLKDDGVTWYGWHATTPRVGRLVYSVATESWTVDVAATAVPVLSSLGNPHASGHLVVDSLDRTWGFVDGDGVISYFVRDSDMTALQGATTLTSDPPAAGHMSRSVAWDGKVGVLWDNQTTGRMRFVYRDDSDPITTWQAEENASSDAIASNADDHGDVVSGPDGELLITWKTGLGGSSDPIIMYARRTAAGAWVDETTVFTRFGAAGDAEFTRPRIVYDATNDTVTVLTTQTFLPGPLVYKVAYRTGAAFGAMETLVGTDVYDVMTPAHSVNFDSGLLAITHSGDDQYQAELIDLAPGRVVYWANTVAEADAFPADAVVYVVGDGLDPLRVRYNGGWWYVTTALQDGASFSVTGIDTNSADITGSGTLQAQTAQVDGTAARGQTTSAALTAQTATVDGSGGKEWVASGALQAAVADINAIARRGVTGDVVIQARQAAVRGVGGNILVAFGALQAQTATMAGTGFTPLVAYGALQAQPASVDASILVGFRYDIAMAAGPGAITATVNRIIKGTGALQAGPANAQVFIWAEQLTQSDEWIIQR